MTRQVLTAAEVAQMLGVSKDYIYDACARDELPHVRLGRSIRFRRESIEQWLREQEQGAAAERS
jgi:excisionase family DNA binding protein